MRLPKLIFCQFKVAWEILDERVFCCFCSIAVSNGDFSSASHQLAVNSHLHASLLDLISGFSKGFPFFCSSGLVKLSPAQCLTFWTNEPVFRVNAYYGSKTETMFVGSLEKNETPLSLMMTLIIKTACSSFSEHDICPSFVCSCP